MNWRWKINDYIQQHRNCRHSCQQYRQPQRWPWSQRPKRMSSYRLFQSSSLQSYPDAGCFGVAWKKNGFGRIINIISTSVKVPLEKSWGFKYNSRCSRQLVKDARQWSGSVRNYGEQCSSGNNDDSQTEEYRRSKICKTEFQNKK